MKRFLLLLITVFNLLQPTNALKINHLSVNKGLSQQDVETVIQDRFGFMWFGTYDGLNRYDGYRIETFRYDPNLPNTIADNRITALYESTDGRIWIGTEGSGLLYFDPSTNKFGKINHASFDAGKRGSIFAFHEISGNKLLVGSTHGLFLIPDISAHSITVEPLQIKRGIKLRVRNFWAEDNSIIWIGTQSGVFRVLFSEQNKLKVLFEDNSNRYVYGVAKIKPDLFAIYGENGIDFYNVASDGFQLIKSNYQLFQGETVINIKKHGNQWFIATRNNVFSWSGSGNPLPFAPVNNDFFKNNILQEIFIDNGNNLWITSRNKGVAQIDLNASKFNEYPLPDKDLFVKSLLILSDNRKAIGIKDYGLLIETSPGSDKFKLMFPGRTVPNMLEDSQRNIWIFSDGLNIMSPSGKLTAVSTFSGYNRSMGLHMSCCEDNNQNIWAGTAHGICKINPKEKSVSYIKFPENQFTSSENLSLNIYFDAYSNAVFCCTKEEGLYRYDISKNKLQQFTTKNGLTSNHVWCLTIQNDSIVWVGTDVGVNRFSTIKNKTTINPASSDPKIRNAKVMAICLDKTRNLWITTSQGLFAYNTQNSRIMEFNYSDGLLSNTLSEVALIDKNGLIWISSISGLNYFDPQKLQPNKYEPNIVLRDFRVFNQSIYPGIEFYGHVILKKSLLETTEITLYHDENNFQLEVAPIHYSNPSKNTIAYKLSGIDKDWIETRNRIISYNNLPSGNYTLEIKGANCDGIWSKKVLTLKIHVKPAPWASWWAYLIYLTIVCTLSFIFYRYYVGRRELKIQLEREQMEHDTERQLNEAKLRFHTNITHEIRTPLALIVAPLYELLQIKIKDTEATKHIQTIAKNTDVLTRLVNQFLDFRKAVTMNYPLQVSHRDFKTTIDKAVSLFTEQARMKGINYQYICESESLMGWYDEEKVSKIVINIISNALKYTPKNGSIFILLEQSEDSAQITVEDTGCGIPDEDLPNIFNRYYQANNNNKGGTGIGLSLAMQLATVHHGVISVKSQLGKGTTLVITIPITKDAFSESECKPSEIIQTGLTMSPLLNEPDEEKLNDSNSNFEMPIVLIIEDNLELAEYMISSLSKHYRTYHTSNGNQGLELALIHTPDIILSDIMIEGMDGIQLTQTLKNDIRTSHIPIILISARSSEEEVMEGLHTGAEDYLTKPFNPEVLKLKIANLIRLSDRNKNRESELETEQKQPLCEREQKFITQIRQIVMDEMISPDFNIEFICKKIGTNRMQLHRKMMSILGVTASDFIKQIRFEQAKKLLETTDMNISETMYEVGLSSLYNFTQTFHKLFNESPSDIIKNRKRKAVQ